MIGLESAWKLSPNTQESLHPDQAGDNALVGRKVEHALSRIELVVEVVQLHPIEPAPRPSICRQLKAFDEFPVRVSLENM